MKYLIFLLLLFSMIFFSTACSEKKSRKEFPTGFLGLGRVGNPELVMGNVINSINSIYDKEGKFPVSDRIVNMLPANKMFIYYSVVNDNYQLSYWSGETTWIYNFKTDSYYETTKDMMHEKWFIVSGELPVSEDAVNYRALSTLQKIKPSLKN